MLERGGNAVDAALAANAVMGLVEPYSCGVGGDLFAIVYEAGTGRLHGLNAGGWAASGATPALIRAQGFDEMPAAGILSVTVPGAVAGWEALRARFGRLPLADFLAPAIFYAERGFPVSEVIAAAWADQVDKLAAEPGAAATLLVDGRAPRAGQVFTNADLARTLREVAGQGQSAFYEGAIAEAIVTESTARGGTLTHADLAEYRPEWVDPIATTYREWTVYELPPNTQGIAALLMLNLMEAFPLAEYGFHSARALHVMIEAKKLAYADMLRYVGDPRFSSIPVPGLLDKAHARARAKRIDPGRAALSVEPSTFDGLTTASGGDTIYLCAADRDGNMVSLIQSLFAPFGSGVVPPGTGIVLHNRGALFSLDERHPNALAPRKRPLHTIIPGFMTRGDTKIAFGIMGGFNQAQAHAQFVADVADFGLDVQRALEAGRFTKSTFDGADVDIEELVPETVRAELVSRGHLVRSVPPRSPTFGYGQAVMRDHTGVNFGASDPRHDGAAIPEAPPVFGAPAAPIPR
jgi:gamma-glutamyltranspeptidase/glutathione hydrolase